MTVYVAPNPRRLKSMIAGTIAHRIGTAFVWLLGLLPRDPAAAIGVSIDNESNQV